MKESISVLCSGDGEQGEGATLKSLVKCSGIRDSRSSSLLNRIAEKQRGKLKASVSGMYRQDEIPRALTQ